MQSHQTYQKPVETKKPPKKTLWVGLGIATATTFQLLRPIPAPTYTLTTSAKIPSNKTALALPTDGQGAVAAKGFGMLGTSGAQTQLSTASIAKVITALCVLERKPLKPGEKGPLITMTKSDVQFFRDEIERNGSRVDVYEGQRMSEYQAIQALMIPSANNIANTLAIWAFGSLDAYQTYANNYVMRQGLVNTRIGSDASGYDPSTVSSASDLTRLGLLAESNPVLIEIAAQTEATFAMAGTMTNYNTLLGQNGINGLKTGNNEQDPGAFLMTGAFLLEGRKVQYSGAVMGASSLSEALQNSNRLAASLPINFEKRLVIANGQNVARYETKWGKKGLVRARKEISVVRWKGDAITLSLESQENDAMKTAPTLTVKNGSQVLTQSLRYESMPTHPSLWWRLTRR